MVPGANHTALAADLNVFFCPDKFGRQSDVKFNRRANLKFSLGKNEDTGRAQISGLALKLGRGLDAANSGVQFQWESLTGAPL